MKTLLDRFYRVEYKVVSGSGTSDETIQYFTYLPSFKVVRKDRLTKEELQNSEFYQRLKEQDRGIILVN